MSEDAKRARELVREDVRSAVRILREAEPTSVEVLAYDNLVAGGATEDPDQLMFTVGARGELTKREADRAGKAFKELRRRYPGASIMLSFLGYDQDPRELWDFPEVCKYLRRFARSAGLNDWREASQVPWMHPGWGVAFLAACGVFGEDAPITVIKPEPIKAQ